MTTSNGDILDRIVARAHELFEAGHGQSVRDVLDILEGPALVTDEAAVERAKLLNRARAAQSVRGPSVDVEIDDDLYAAAESESARTGIAVRLVLVRWALIGQATEAESRAAVRGQ